LKKWFFHWNKITGRKDLVDYVSTGWKRYAKDFADFYRDREKN